MFMQNGHLNLVSFLIEKNANIHHANCFGDTPLWIASHVCLVLLSIQSNYLKREAHLRIVFNQNGHLEIVEFLIENGAEVDQANKQNQTPLWVAVRVRMYCFFFSFSPFFF